MFYEVIPSKLFGPQPVLTYSSDQNLQPGHIVEIPLGKAKTVGIVKKLVQAPTFKTKPITKLLYSQPLPTHLLKTADFLADYYLIPLPLTLSLLLPRGVEKTRHQLKELKAITTKSSNRAKSTQKSTQVLAKSTIKTEQNLKLPIIPLNNAQKNAIVGLKEAQEHTKLLHGVTGSGKTNIYLKLAENALKSEKSTIILVPEIALTSQLVRVFSETFGSKITLIHSRQTEAERHLIWEKLLTAPENTPQIIVGPRSALFCPVKNLSLIIVDECHESTYFQENAPKYSALRVASFMAKTLGIDFIEGSATPLVQDYYLAKRKNSLVRLTEKAKTTAVKPEIKIIDFKNRDYFAKNRYFSTPLLESISKNLEHHRQSLIFHNRRGSSPLSLCEDCGEELLCPHCFLPLTLHSDTYELVCHTCGYKTPVPHSCPHCKSPNILHKGFGTKLLESELKKLFPSARVARFDADNKKSETLDFLYDDIKAGKIDILIGTQAIAKGLDLENLATVGVVQADAGLSLPDFSAEEKTFQLLTQVIGRVGRGHLDTAEVFIQTFRPDHPTLNFAIAENYPDFATYLLKKRRRQNLPPFSYLARLELTMKTESIVLKKIQAFHQTLSQNPKLQLSVPTPAFHERTDKGYTWQLLVRAKSRPELIRSLQNLDPHIRLTLDPPSLL